jgi:hypothetical protein
LGKIIVVGKKVNIENSNIKAKSKEIGNNNKVIGHHGTVIINGEKVNMENSSIKASSSMGSGNVVIGTSGSVILGSH